MLTNARSPAVRAPMSAEEQTQYDVAHQCIDRLRGDIRGLGRKIKAVGPKPVVGSFARLHGGMGSTHLGGVPCDWDAHNPAKAGGNSWALCRKSHTKFDAKHEPSQACIDGALEDSVPGSVVRNNNV
jgi:hypothetical protein